MRTLLLTFVGVLLSYGAQTDSADSKQVVESMEALKQAMIQKDGPALEKLLTDDLTYTHSSGKTETKKDVVTSIGTGKSIIMKLEFIGTTVHVYGNTATAKGRVDLWHNPSEAIHLDVLHVWVKSGGKWKLAARQAIRLTS